ncbi:hypothetical protein BGY98DRAFT_995893 [Russula aff. rugulosa BPL654]|nr:hypothetical protein BGY98DRAFT_995893 [Russula aff. rugulosa BPL654]
MMRTSELIPSKTPSQRRSWRRTVAHALALAQSAVELDSTSADPMGALDGYTKSVRQLRRILVRLERHGAHSEASRLATICDSYCERMRVLSAACAVPPPPYDYNELPALPALPPHPLPTRRKTLQN